MKYIFLPLVFLVGCASWTPPVKKEITKSFEINKNFDGAWTSVVKYFSLNNITFKSMDKTSGLIATDIKVFEPFNNSGYIDCGVMKGTNLAVSRGSVIYNVFLEKISDNKTQITINLKPVMTTTSSAGYRTVSADVECYSTGKFENEIYQSVK